MDAGQIVNAQSGSLLDAEWCLYRGSDASRCDRNHIGLQSDTGRHDSGLVSQSGQCVEMSGGCPKNP